MNLMILDSHPAVYQFIKGQAKSRNTAVMRVTEITSRIFVDTYDVAKIRKVAREFLKIKESEYKAGNIKIKAIY